MKSSLTKGLEEDQARELRGDFLSAHLLRKRIVEVLNEKIDSKHTEIRNSDNYANASWPLLVADSIGYERALKEVISILSEKEV